MEEIADSDVELGVCYSAEYVLIDAKKNEKTKSEMNTQCETDKN